MQPRNSDDAKAILSRIPGLIVDDTIQLRAFRRVRESGEYVPAVKDVQPACDVASYSDKTWVRSPYCKLLQCLYLFVGAPLEEINRHVSGNGFIRLFSEWDYADRFTFQTGDEFQDDIFIINHQHLFIKDGYKKKT